MTASRTPRGRRREDNQDIKLPSLKARSHSVGPPPRLKPNQVTKDLLTEVEGLGSGNHHKSGVQSFSDMRSMGDGSKPETYIPAPRGRHSMPASLPSPGSLPPLKGGGGGGCMPSPRPLVAPLQPSLPRASPRGALQAAEGVSLALPPIHSAGTSPPSGASSAASPGGVSVRFDTELTSMAWGGGLIVAGVDGAVRALHAGSLRPAYDLQGHAGRVTAVDATEGAGGEALVASASDDASIRLWDGEAGVALRTLVGHGGGVRCCRFGPMGRLLASGSTDGVAMVWDVETAAVVWTLASHAGGVNDVAFSPDGGVLATATGHGVVRVWDLGAGSKLHSMHGHDGQANACAFSPDGKVLASGSSDGQVMLWDPNTGERIRTLPSGPGGAVRCLSFASAACSGRGTAPLAAGYADGAVRVWDCVGGAELFSRVAHKGPVRAVRWRPHGGAIASASSAEGNLQVWPVPEQPAGGAGSRDPSPRRTRPSPRHQASKQLPSQPATVVGA